MMVKTTVAVEDVGVGIIMCIVVVPSRSGAVAGA